MTTGTVPAGKDMLHKADAMRGISVMMPFAPKISLKTEIDHQLKVMVDKIEKYIRENGDTGGMANLVPKIKNLIKNLDYQSDKKSLVIFVSPDVEKVYYLDTPLEEKLLVNEPFSMREILYNNKAIDHYLVLLLSSKKSSTWLGTGRQLSHLKSMAEEHVAAVKNEVPEKVSNFSDPAYRKEVMLEKFLRHVDDGLDELLKQYALPVFVLGAERTMGHFKKITHHHEKVIDYVHGNFEEATETALSRVLEPYIDKWKNERLQSLLQQLDAAKGLKKLATGIQQVWTQSLQGQSGLLVVEKNYHYPAQKGAGDDIFFSDQPQVEGYIPDAVEPIIKNILDRGGDIVFAADGALASYEHIALMQFY